MATRANPQRSGKQPAGGRGSRPGRSVPGGVDVGRSAASGESVAIAGGRVICMLCLVGFITLTGFLYADLQAARGANKHIERKVKEVIERCDRE